MSSFTERDIEPGEQCELRQAIAFARQGPLRFDEGVENMGTGSPHFAATQTEWDVMGVVLYGYDESLSYQACRTRLLKLAANVGFASRNGGASSLVHE